MKTPLDKRRGVLEFVFPVIVESSGASHGVEVVADLKNKPKNEKEFEISTIVAALIQMRGAASLHFTPADPTQEDSLDIACVLAAVQAHRRHRHGRVGRGSWRGRVWATGAIRAGEIQVRQDLPVSAEKLQTFRDSGDQLFFVPGSYSDDARKLDGTLVLTAEEFARKSSDPSLFELSRVIVLVAADDLRVVLTGLFPNIFKSPQQQTPTGNPPPFCVPVRSLGSQFVGREQVITHIHSALTATGDPAGVVVIHGFIGVGKSRAAAEYAHSYRDQYPGGIYWVSAQDKTRRDAIREIAAFRGAPPRPDLSEDGEISALWSFLNGFPLSLIIFDNFPEVPPGQTRVRPALEHWLPSAGQIHTIVTCRRPWLSPHAREVPLSPLDWLAAMAILGRYKLPRDKSESNAARDVAQELGCLPVALELAGAFLRGNNTFTYARYLKDLRNVGSWSEVKRVTKILGPDVPGDCARTIVAVVNKLWRHLRSPAKLVLKILALLAPVEVPRMLARDVIFRLRGRPPDDHTIDHEFEAGIRDAAALSMLSETVSGDLVAHRLVLSYADAALGRKEREQLDIWCEVAVKMSWRAHVQDETSVERSRSHALVLRPHLQVLAMRAVAMKRFGAAWQRTSALATYHLSEGSPELALPWARIALDSAQRMGGAGSPQYSMRAKHDLASALAGTGQIDEARELFQECLFYHNGTGAQPEPALPTSGNTSHYTTTDDKTMLFIMDPEPSSAGSRKRIAEQVMTMMSLASISSRDEATVRLSEAVELVETTIGASPLLAAVLLQAAKVIDDRAHASALVARSIVIAEDCDHPDLLTACLWERGHQRASWGEFAGAREDWETALDLMRAQLGRDHMNVAKASEDLGGVLVRLGDYDAAFASLETAFIIGLRRKGADKNARRRLRFLLKLARSQLHLGDFGGRAGVLVRLWRDARACAASKDVVESTNAFVREDGAITFGFDLRSLVG